MTLALTLHSFATSSASHRVRIALHHKGLPFDYVAVPIAREGSEALTAYRAMNPQALVPTLVHGSVQISQSIAILEYLEEIAPTPALLPADPAARARVRSIAMYIVSEIQPLQNLRVFRHIQKGLGHDEATATKWRQHWVSIGLDALEKTFQEPATGTFCHGDSPTIADCCLVPQVHAATRWGLDVARWPTVSRIAAHASTLDAFQKAAPENQPDA